MEGSQNQGYHFNFGGPNNYKGYGMVFGGLDEGPSSFWEITISTIAP